MPFVLIKQLLRFPNNVFVFRNFITTIIVVVTVFLRNERSACKCTEIIRRGRYNEGEKYRKKKIGKNRQLIE